MEGKGRGEKNLGTLGPRAENENKVNMKDGNGRRGKSRIQIERKEGREGVRQKW